MLHWLQLISVLHISHKEVFHKLTWCIFFFPLWFSWKMRTVHRESHVPKKWKGRAKKQVSSDFFWGVSSDSSPEVKMALLSALFWKYLYRFTRLISIFVQVSLRKPPTLLTASVRLTNQKGTLPLRSQSPAPLFSHVISVCSVMLYTGQAEVGRTMSELGWLRAGQNQQI